MDLEDVIDAQLSGTTLPPDLQLPEDWQDALAAHEALVHAIGETILLPGAAPPRELPSLPSDYQILHELGRGGMGVVYLAEQKSLNRRLAVKVLRPGELTFGPLVRRFLNEARHLARLRHPNIVSIHEVGTAGDEPYFTMDYIEGESLAEVLKEGPLPPTRAVRILKQATLAVAHAHAEGIIHRDIKPANVLITTADHGAAEVLVSDFGLARDLASHSDQTGSGVILGTPAYMAPEQARGQTALIGEATDIHALGVMLYEMLTGRPPYGRDSAADVLTRLLHVEPIAPRQVDRRIPRDLETICLKAMAKSPEARYQSAQALISDLERWEQGETVLARRASVGARLLRIGRRHWRTLAAVVATSVILLAVAPFLFDQSAEELIRWGQEEHAQGDHVEAVRLFGRAAGVATGTQRRQALDLMLRCARESGDLKHITDAALQIVQHDPDAGFGEYDFLVAQALVAQIQAKNPNHVIRWTPDEHNPLLKLAERRLARVIASGTADEEQLKLAHNLLEQVRAELQNEPLKVSAEGPEQKPQLPSGSTEHLLQQASDDAVIPWQRGLAALAAARQLQSAGDNDAALGAYRLALAQMSRVYPVHQGMGNVFTELSKPPAQRLVPSPESQWLHETAKAIEALDPTSPRLTASALRFRVEGVDIPSNILLALSVTLHDPALPKQEQRLHSDRSASFNLDEVPVDATGTAEIGVVPGRYLLSINLGSRSLSGDQNRELYRRLILDFDRLPSEIEIGDEPVELTIPARLLDGISLLSPNPGEPVNVEKHVFRWSTVDGARRYGVRFSWITLEPGGRATQESGPRLKAGESELCLGNRDDVPEFFKKALRNGRTLLWAVDAYDENGRQIGVSLENERPFVVAGALK